MHACVYISWVGPYYDGELTQRRVAELELHLRRCSICAAELEELRRLSRLISKQPSPPVLAALAIARLHQYADDINATIRDGDRSLRRFAELLSGVAAALLVGSTLWLMRAPSASAEPVVSAPAPWESAAAAIIPVDDTAPAAQSLNTARWIVTELQHSPPDPTKRQPR